MILKFISAFGITLGLCMVNASQAQGFASKDDQTLTGVWQGTLGKQAVTVCFNPMQSEKQYGHYYYQRHLQTISLSRLEKSDRIAEYENNKLTGMWHLSATADKQQLNGKWAKPDGVAELTVALRRTNGGEYDSKDDAQREYLPCASDAFLKALETPLPIIKGEVKQYKGKQYQIVERRLIGDPYKFTRGYQFNRSGIQLHGDKG